MNEHFQDPERKPEAAPESDDLQHLREQSLLPSEESAPEVEEVLRRDAELMEVPDRIAERLERSIQQESSSPGRPWWKRILNWS